jgi:hypothetical protein
MEKIEIIRLLAEVVAFALIAFLGGKTFKYKDSLVTIIRSAKDAKITEAEFQEIVDAVKKDTFGDSKL